MPIWTHILHKIKEDGKMLLLCLYVDDLFLIGNDETIVVEFKSFMKKEFEMTNLGLMHYFICIEVKQSSKRIFIT